MRGGRRGRGIVAVGAEEPDGVVRVESSCVSWGAAVRCFGVRLRTVWKRERMTPICGCEVGGFVLRWGGVSGWGMTQVGCVGLAVAAIEWDGAHD